MSTLVVLCIPFFVSLFHLRNHLAYSMCPQDPKEQGLGHNTYRCAFLAMHSSILVQYCFQDFTCLWIWVTTPIMEGV